MRRRFYYGLVQFWYDTSMQAYLLVIEVEPVSVGGDYPMLPLHCTLVHWFWASTNPAEFERLLADALRSFRPQKLIIG